MSENESRQGQTTRPAGKNSNRNTGAAGGAKRKRRPQPAAKKDFKNNVQKSVETEGQKSTGQNPKRKKQERSPASEKNRNAQNRHGGVKNAPAGNAQRNNHRGNRKGPPKIHDDYDDIRSYGGRYLQLPDYDELETDPLSSAGLFSLTADNTKKRGTALEDTEAASISEEQAPVAGRNAVRELLRSGRSIDKIFVKAGQREGSLVAIVAEARKKQIPISEVAQEKLDQLARGVNHQGVVAVAAEKEYTDIDGILNIAAERGEIPLIVVADSIEDPHNLGALIRCAECAGAHGVIIPRRRSAGLTPVVTKASAGALEHMAVAKVSNIGQTVTELKKRGLWVFVSEAGGTAYYDADFRVPAAIVFGSEGAGVAKTVREKSDFTVSIPMYGKVNSLNVSTAASVILCHAARMQHDM
ncbi:MAG: 23S rRNA (guanosine(2251)-2'-O)-methyltransferase RlmB [Clostridiales bacterium]|jgi:23S rRNA (guanosine2251-2'-O)-methyltransferase|nr:23S rRNA (guanosine(2251)-2'-O)-methyltransferase RlmB [Clostridiales bacterium]